MMRCISSCSQILRTHANCILVSRNYRPGVQVPQVYDRVRETAGRCLRAISSHFKSLAASTYPRIPAAELLSITEREREREIVCNEHSSWWQACCAVLWRTYECACARARVRACVRVCRELNSAASSPQWIRLPPAVAAISKNASYGDQT